MASFCLENSKRKKQVLEKSYRGVSWKPLFVWTKTYPELPPSVYVENRPTKQSQAGKVSIYINDGPSPLLILCCLGRVGFKDRVNTLKTELSLDSAAGMQGSLTCILYMSWMSDKRNKQNSALYMAFKKKKKKQFFKT